MQRHLWWIGSVFFLTLNAYGQADRGGMAGTVKDSSGGVAPGATVTIVRDDAGLTRLMVSSSSGACSIPDLPVGMYIARVALKGFQTVKFENVEIALEHTTAPDVQLNVSSAGTERVEVVGSKQQLDENAVRRDSSNSCWNCSFEKCSTHAAISLTLAVDQFGP